MARILCPECRGEGRVESTEEVRPGIPGTELCNLCRGSGFVFEEDLPPSVPIDTEGE